MKSSTPYDEVVNYLLDTIGSTLNGLGIDDERVKPLTEAQIHLQGDEQLFFNWRL